MARVPTAFGNGFGQVQRRPDNTPFQTFDTPIDAFDRGSEAQAMVGATLTQLGKNLQKNGHALATPEAQRNADLVGKIGVEKDVRAIRQSLIVDDSGQQGPMASAPTKPKDPENYVNTEFSKIRAP